MTKAEWLLKCGWIQAIDDEKAWHRLEYPRSPQGAALSVRLETAIRIQTAVIETECRELWRHALATALSDTTPALGAQWAEESVRLYRAAHIPPCFTDEATK